MGFLMTRVKEAIGARRCRRKLPVGAYRVVWSLPGCAILDHLVFATSAAAARRTAVAVMRPALGQDFRRSRVESVD